MYLEKLHQQAWAAWEQGLVSYIFVFPAFSGHTIGAQCIMNERLRWNNGDWREYIAQE